ncbi:MAG: Lrp/AsnC family transcriptional regulator [Desulfobacterales bacterium]|jgi:Lrp/AsnC family leucine-responsive transcriptional regulator
MLDKIAVQILQILQRKARIPNVEVARQVGMAPSAVLERIRKLENQGYIEGYEVRLNPLRFNRRLVTFAFVYPRTDADIDALGGRLAALPAVQEVHYVSGEDAYLIKLRTADTAALSQLLRDHLRRFKEVRSVRSLIVLASVKESSHIPIDAEATTDVSGPDGNK